MDSYEIIILRRDCEAFLVPSGARIMLNEGTEVTLTQARGTSFTVNVYGNLLRVDGKDAEALGKEISEAMQINLDAPVEEQIWAQLKTCYDPEIPVDIVGLGLIYTCEIKATDEAEAAENNSDDKTISDSPQQDVVITMTLTAPGCGMGPVIANEVKSKLECLPGIHEATVDIVFDPSWDRSMMSDAAKLQLGII